MAVFAISAIAPNYSGEMSAEINKYKATLIPKDQWDTQYDNWYKYARPTEEKTMTSILQSRRPGPTIGMTTSEVINKTSWGQPKKVNKTTTEKHVSEQWIYEGFKYLYFEDGKLTSISE